MAFYSGPFGSFLCADHICNSYDFPLIAWRGRDLSAKGHVDRFDDVAFVYYCGRVVPGVDKPVVEFSTIMSWQTVSCRISKSFSIVLPAGTSNSIPLDVIIMPGACPGFRSETVNGLLTKYTF